MNDNIKQNIYAHNKIAHIYNQKHNEIYNEVEQIRLKNTINNLVKLNKGEKTLRVLDFGAGTGNITLKFLKYNCNVTALDISQKELKILEKKVKDKKKLSIKFFNGENIPFANDTFDIVASYSVLHHIPEYLNAIKEMIRVTKKDGFIYIDHEANENKWNPSISLKNYYSLTRLTPIELLKKKIKTREVFSINLWRGIFIKLFINKRYKTEGDIHVWKDDHIEWKDIKKIVDNLNCKIIEEKNYLLYRTKGGIETFKMYNKKCSDMKYIFIQKSKSC